MLTLTRAEIAELTGRRQRAHQRARLDALGIPYAVRDDGALLVSRKAAERALGADLARHRNYGIDWQAAARRMPGLVRV